MKVKHALAFLFASFYASSYAQDEPAPPPSEPEKLAVFVSGASDPGINKTLGSKLLNVLLQAGNYTEIKDSDAFHTELSENPGGAGRIAHTGKQHGADVVCVVGLTEAFGAYSITARLIRTSDFQTFKTASLDRSLKSLDDLTFASNDLASQLFLQPPPPAPVPPPPSSVSEPAPASPVAAAAPAGECTSKFNLNELVSKIQSGFPASLKDCATTLAKDIALSKSPFGKKTPLKEPKAFMTDCAIDGVKQKLPSGAEEYIKPVESFIQNILNAASAASGGLDVAKLSSAIGGMNVMDLIDELKAKAARDACATDEPYEAPYEDDGGGDSSEEDDGKVVSFGLRAGVNLSHLEVEYGYTSGSYNSTIGFQLGLVLDIAPSSWFHLQPGIMYIQKGAEDYSGVMTSHYIEIPFLFSFKISALRLNAGPYFGILLDGPDFLEDTDYGLNAGLGFDIGMFYIGVFYGLGVCNVDNRPGVEFYNRTLGFNFGVNL